MTVKSTSNLCTLELNANLAASYPYAIFAWIAAVNAAGTSQIAASYGIAASDYYDGLFIVDDNATKSAQSRHPGESNAATQTGAPNGSPSVMQPFLGLFFDQSHRGVAFGTTTITQNTYSIAGSDVINFDKTVLFGRNFNGGPSFPAFTGEIAEWAIFNISTWGTLSGGTFTLNSTGTAAVAALMAAAKPETVAGVIQNAPLLNSTSLSTFDGSKTFTVVGSGFTNGSITHPVSRAAPDVTAPTLASAAVANSTPTVVNLTMSEAMDTGFVPAASAFTVSGHTVSSVAITGSTINLTVSAAFVNGEAARTVAYTQPGTNNARDLAGNLLANFTGQAITNNVAAVDTTPPTFSSAQVANAAPANIVITMSETLAAFTPAASAFAVSGGKTVSSVARSGATVTLTCSAAYAFGDTITVTYTKPGTNMLQDAAGNQTASFGPSAVTNNISSGATVTITSPSAGGKRVADGTYRASVACNVTALDKSTHAVLERKTGLTSPVSGPFVFTSTVLTAGTERLFLVKADVDDKDLGAFFATPV